MTTSRNISIDRAIAMLSSIKEFQNLSSKDIEMAVAVCQWYRYETDSEIIHYHDQSNGVFFVVQGEVRIMYHGLSGQEVILCDLCSGEMFGELTAIDGRSGSATAIAKTSVLLAAMSADDYCNLIYTNRKIAEVILQRLTGQIRRLSERIYDYSTLAVRSRIQSELLRFAMKNMDSENTAIISPAPTQAEIANLVSTHREAVSRELNELVKNKLIKRQKNTLLVLDIEKLSRLVTDARGGL